MIDIDIYQNPTLNIGIIGCISSGKSTLMNSLFSETYSDMKIKKTTMCPQVYKTNKKISKSKRYANDIRKQNEALNKKLYEEGTLNQCTEVIYEVLPIPDIFDKLKHGKKIEYKIYDIPGLNDSITKNKFYDYIKNNFYKFDIVIYNVDINSGLNTTDELDILNLIKSCIEETKTKYNNDVKLMIICNKCDDLTENDDGELIGSDDIEEMYKQVCDIVKSNGLSCPIIKYSAAYTYMYRSINTPENIDIEYINKIGIDNFGRISWSKKTKGKSIDDLWELIKPHLSDSTSQSLVLSGFEQFKKVICDNILMGRLVDVMYSKINFHTDESDFMTRYNFIKYLDDVLESNEYGNKKLNEYFNRYIAFLETEYKFDEIDEDNAEMIKKYFDILNELKTLELSKKQLSKINELIDIYNDKRAKYNLLFIQNLEEDIDSGEIFNILPQIIEKTTDGIKKLSNIHVLNKLQKVPIGDFNRMVKYLTNHKMKKKLLINVYSSKLINVFNNCEYPKMIRNYILRIYFETTDEFYNWMSCCIESNTFIHKFDKKNYDKIIDYFDEFVSYYNTEIDEGPEEDDADVSN